MGRNVHGLLTLRAALHGRAKSRPRACGAIVAAAAIVQVQLEGYIHRNC